MTRLSKDFKEMSNPRILKQLWQPSEASLDAIMEKTSANRYCKHFFGQHHLKALVLFQLTEGQSLEDLHQSLNQDLRFQLFTRCPPISKSQLSRANTKRPVEAFRQTALQLINQLPSQTPISDSLQTLLECTRIFDGTSFTLDPHASSWAIYRHITREPDAGWRMTLRMRLDTLAPDQVFTHSSRDNSANYFASCIDFNSQGFLYLFDREYNKHQTVERISESKNFFITRMKEDACYQILEEHARSSRFRHGLKITKDQSIQLGKKPHHRIVSSLRRIEAVTDEGKRLVFLTNLFHLAASTIAQLYRQRWQIELFFKWIKQHLKIKRFLSHSLNGILLQIYAALILYLLLVLFKTARKIQLSLFDLYRRLKRQSYVFSPVIIFKEQKLKQHQHPPALISQSLRCLSCF
jgi:hypothetical protein